MEYSYYGKQCGGFSIQMPHNSSIPLHGIAPKEIKSVSQRNICTPIFIVALLAMM
jgi:hypothetical protein